MTTQLILTRAIVALIVGCAFLLWVAIGVSEFIALGNDMTEDEDFQDLCARANKAAS